jgi:hypothetical protein
MPEAHIINSDDDELFIMSVGDEELKRNAPASVLMTGSTAKLY